MKLDDGATLVVTEAHGLAARLGHVASDVPHLLWAMAAKGSGGAERSLRALGRAPDELLRAVERELPPPAPDFGGMRARRPADDQVQVTRAFKAVLEDAAGGPTAPRRVDEAALLDALLATTDDQALAFLQRVGLEPGERLTTRPASSNGQAADPGDSRLLELVGQFGRLVTEEARAGSLDPTIGRTTELRRLIHILGRRRKNNPVLLGEPGVGKTAIVEGLAQAIVAGEVPQSIAGMHIFALDIGSLVAGTKYRGEFEERVQLLLEWLAEGRDSIILFIDEVHLLAGAGGAEGAIDAASFFKPQLARGELRIIGATTAAEYRSYILRDGALERRFQPVFVAEPTEPETVAMLRGLRATYEEFHGVTITDAALEAAVRISVRRLPERRLPDKAIDLIDEAASRARAAQDAELATPQPPPAASAQPDAAVVVTPTDILGVMQEWVASNGTDKLQREVYATGDAFWRRQLTGLQRRIRR